MPDDRGTHQGIDNGAQLEIIVDCNAKSKILSPSLYS